ncbi:SRPBCC family protein [Undibacterium sp. Ji22W]|jgi:uncharacterized protein YndB with AHSA1/START domain|uniref:SRPBCC family protein n=1 Tax=Undibacterium sp. Ji22W TaxID=3413038 RepID=UPI003BF3A793
MTIHFVFRVMKNTLLVAISVALATSLATAAELPPIEAIGVVNAPVREVWKAWTTADGLKAWLAPHAEFDLRLGGLMRTNYSKSGSLSDDGTIENRVLAFESERMIAIQVSRAPTKFPFPNAVKNMWTVLYFLPDGESRTTLRIVGLGFSDDPESAKMREFFKRGNEYTLSELQKYYQR